MKKTLFTLTLLLVSLFSFADADSYLKEHIEIYLKLDNCSSYVAVPTANKEKIVMSPCFYQRDDITGVSNLCAINENGITQISKFNEDHYIYQIYSTRYGNRSLLAIYIRGKIDELKNEGVQIDIDFDYLFCASHKLINERGEIIYDLGDYSPECYCDELFYFMGKNRESGKWEVLSLAKLLSDYATGIKQTSAKAELQSSKTYDITGVEVDTEAKGITIQDGKKIMK